MSEPRAASNVYYLPVQAAPVSVPEPGRVPAPSWRAAFAHTLWRLRFAFTAIGHVFRTPVPVLTSPDHPFQVQRPDVTTRRRAWPAVPARIIDFSAARARRRPA